MKTCKKCNEELEDGFDDCWKCTTSEDKTIEKFNANKLFEEQHKTEDDNNGCLINILSLVAVFLVLTIVILLQISIFNEANIVAPAIAACTYSPAKKLIKTYFNSSSKP
jgi:uncharacterized membrane protein YvbJ